MSYQVIARKYRPQKFAEVVGQQAIVTTLKNSLAQGRTAHAYLFCGSRGTGKTTLARLLAKSLNCDKKNLDQEPCNQCSSCQAITAGRSLDVLEIDGASNRGIDDIRQINETVAYASSAGKWKIYIIDEVHMLTKEAFNALLKTLEEPPAGVKFFFATTEPEKVPETIISRCQRFDLNRISEEEIISKLRSICDDFERTIEPGALRLLAHRSRGGLRDAESMLDQVLCFTEGTINTDTVAKHLGLPTRRFFFQLDEHCAKEDLPFALQLTEEVFEAGCDPILFLEGLAEHYRLLLLLIYDPKQIEHRQYAWLEGEIKQAYLLSASLYTTEQCLFILEEIIDWLQKISKSPYPRLVIEILLTTILRSRQRISLDVLVHRLTLLESSLLNANQEHSAKKTPGQTMEMTSQIAQALQVPPEESPQSPNAKQNAGFCSVESMAKEANYPSKADDATCSETPLDQPLQELYRNNMNNQVFDKKAPRNSCLERETIVQEQGSSEDKDCEVRDRPQTLNPSSSNPFRDLSSGFEAPTAPVAYATSKPDETSSKRVSKSDGLIVCEQPLKPTPSETDSSGCFGIKEPIQQESKAPDHSVRYETIMRFAAVELEGAIKKPLT